MDWLVTLLALLLAGGLCQADAAPESSTISEIAAETTTIPAAELENPETSTIPITSLRMYHFDPPAKRRSFKVSPTPKPSEETAQPQNTTVEPPSKEVLVSVEQSNHTLEVIQPRSGKALLPPPPSQCYLNETKADDEEIIGWLRGLPADRKLRLLKGLGYDPANCTRPRRRCSKKTPPEMRKSLTPPPALTKLPTTTPKVEEPPATTTTTTTTPAPTSTTTTTTTPATTTSTPESEELTTTTEFVPRRRMLPPTTTTTTSTPDPTVTESITPSSGASTTTTTTTVAPPPKKEKSKCRKKKKAAAKKIKEMKE